MCGVGGDLFALVQHPAGRVGGVTTLYGGSIGAAYVRGLRDAGSPIDLLDLAEHRSELHAPLMAPFRDLHVRTSPPTSQGVTMLEAMLAIDRLNADPDPFGA